MIRQSQWLSIFAMELHAGSRFVAARQRLASGSVRPAAIEPNALPVRLMHRIGAKGPGMRVLGILAIIALSWFVQPAFAHAAADFAASASQAAVDAAADMDWMVFNLRLKLVFIFFIMAAIAGLAQLAGPSQKNGNTELVPVRVR
jgi:hypothetical protein